MKNPQPENLTSYIELHERSWGMEPYPSRPKLDAILKSPVVVFWRSTDVNEKRWTIGLYDDLKTLETYFIRLLLRSNVELPKKIVAKIYKDGKQVIVSEVNIAFQEVTSP